MTSLRLINFTSHGLRSGRLPDRISTFALTRLRSNSARKFYLVQSISCFRIIATLVFAWFAFKGNEGVLVSALYLSAMVSDLADGFLSRKLDAATHFGKILDLIADKSLTIISLLYAASRGVDLFPLAIIAVRDLVMIGMRLVIIEGEQLLPTSRVIGGTMASVVWGTTLFVVYAQHSHLIWIASLVYWCCAIFAGVNLAVRLYNSADRIVVASKS
jgi:phosphatidylglycerophosphate synthase